MVNLVIVEVEHVTQLGVTVFSPYHVVLRAAAVTVFDDTALVPTDTFAADRFQLT